MPSWVVWAVIAVALAVGEMLTAGTFVLGLLALAAAVTAAVAAAGAGWPLSLLVFAALSLGSLALLRPIIRRHVRQPPELRTGTAALVGARALVVERVDGNGGRVKIGGEVWSARSLDEEDVIEPGTQVQVAEIDGATALVYQ
jgi:membrane protein implicated in regulation of membrane protease activity